MQKLSFLVWLLAINIIFAQVPHGDDFDIDCEECHNTDDWKIEIDTLKFNHSLTEFNLVGQHNSVDCRNCHNSLLFSDIDSQCSLCHKDIHQNTVGNNCEDCHNSNSWLVHNINDIHLASRFPLEGTHKNLNCIDCHRSINNLVFDPLGVECVDCHRADYQSTKFPNHLTAGFSVDCQECHQINDFQWSDSKITHDFFPLINGHNIGSCFDCHSDNSFQGLTQDCISCHQSDYSSAVNPNHVNNSFSTDCEQCHSLNSNWTPALFTNHDNIFQLVGAHKLIENDCNKCHETGYSNTPTQCYDCHKSNYENTTNPSHQSAGFGNDCETCHNSIAWEPASFDHDNQYFPIYSGEHNNEWNNCSDCHTNSTNFQVFECITCHEHNQNDMNDKHSGINGYAYESTACLSCHPTGEGEGGLNHSLTNFPLSGAHITTDCSDCHLSGYEGTSTECSSCHLTEYQNSVNPNHQQLGLQQNCEECHTANPDWRPATFVIHNEYFQLEGAHISISNDCNSCHEGDYNSTGNLCFDCHNNDYNNTNDPNHQATGFGTTCEDCHTQTAWEPAQFDHDNQYFPIYSGKHNNQWNDCADCHTISSNFQTFECITCHEHNKNETDDEHSGVQGYQYISTECLACHPTGDEEGSFNHAISLFPLTGAHLSVDCSSCHENGYSNTPSDCFECHQTNYNSSQDPIHTNAGISVECQECHTSNSWTPSIFDHNTTGFELAGGHNLQQCSDCHSINTSNASAECISCHQSNYELAQDHTTLSYPTTCEDCHNSVDWKDANFNHSSTRFPLTGEHNNVNCGDCHISGYAETPTLCSDCHLNNYNSSSNPNHSNLGLSTACDECHTTNANWEPASFAIHDNYFVIQGAHLIINNDCASCHNGDYNNTPNSCYGCHQSEYNSTLNPPHQSSGFGTGCEDCHTQAAWKPAQFDHDGQYFPIYSGEHREEWNSCTDCHTDNNNFAQFTCLICHEHSKTKMDDKHKEENGYLYDSNACLDCHPNGKSEAMREIIIDRKR